MDGYLDEMQVHYARGEEAARLDEPVGVVEYERTKEIVLRALPEPPAAVADIGGGPGRYARWLAELGYDVQHRDLAPGHVDQLRASAPESVHARLGDARNLDLPDASVDAVLMLGPLYHLRERADRVTALREAGRVAKPGAPVFAAVISRWAPRLHGGLVDRLQERAPAAMADLVDEVERTGRLQPLFEGSFCGYTHRPAELEAEIGDAGLELTDLVGVEGLAFALADLGDRMADAQARDVVLDTARSLERVPELLGAGPHLVATARRVE
jgi:SAM-dependent methyltransferase